MDLVPLCTYNMNTDTASGHIGLSHDSQEPPAYSCIAMQPMQDALMGFICCTAPLEPASKGLGDSITQSLSMNSGIHMKSQV